MGREIFPSLDGLDELALGSRVFSLAGAASRPRSPFVWTISFGVTAVSNTKWHENNGGIPQSTSQDGNGICGDGTMGERTRCGWIMQVAGVGQSALPVLDSAISAQPLRAWLVLHVRFQPPGVIRNETSCRVG